MKLSVAIREGAKLGPQGFYSRETNAGMCAIGGAMKFATGSTRGQGFDEFPLFTVQCPCGETDRKYLLPRHIIYGHIIHLNDTERWSRERIASWVEALERADEATASALKSAERPVKEKELVAVG